VIRIGWFADPVSVVHEGDTEARLRDVAVPVSQAYSERKRPTPSAHANYLKFLA